MRVLFVNPPWWEGREGKRTSLFRDNRPWRRGVRAGSRWPFTYVGAATPDNPASSDYMPYPFFLGYAATYVAQATGADVVFRDSIAMAESYATFETFLRQEQFDYIVIESATPSWQHDRGLIHQIKRLTQAKIIIVGPIAALGQKVLDEVPAVAVIKGEYEKNVVKVLRGQSGVIEYDLLTEEEMNAAPFPYFDETMAHLYYDYNPAGQQFPHAQVWASRGCPYKCIFCVWPATMTGNDPDGSGKRTVRYYSADYMRGFLKELVSKYGFKSIYFDDDTFNLGTRHVEAMCEVMTEIGLPWSAMCRADTIKMETWRVMRDSGCFGVKLGFESGNQFVVDKIVNKHLDLDYARSVVHQLKDLGMTVHGTFTYGLPGETIEQMKDTKAFIASLPFDTVQESGTAEIEGTPLATLRESGSLQRFAAARIDTSYNRHVDGNKKADEIAKMLQDS